MYESGGREPLHFLQDPKTFGRKPQKERCLTDTFSLGFPASLFAKLPRPHCLLIRFTKKALWNPDFIKWNVHWRHFYAVEVSCHLHFPASQIQGSVTWKVTSVRWHWCTYYQWDIQPKHWIQNLRPELRHCNREAASSWGYHHTPQCFYYFCKRESWEDAYCTLCELTQ